MRESFEKHIQKTGTNKAGYSEYTRKKIKSPEIDNPSVTETLKEEESVMSRRKFLTGLASTALSVGAGGGVVALSKMKKNEFTVKQEAENDPSYDSNQLGKLSESGDEMIEAFSDSRYFNNEVEKFATHYAKDLPEVLKYANKTTLNDPENRSRLEYVSQESHIEGIPEVLAQELQKYIVGLCDVESSFNASKISPSGAAGALQMMPVTWKEHGNQAENILSLVAGVDAARSKFKQIYHYLIQNYKQTLDSIKAEFFFGEDKDFEMQFLTPIVINGYNAGEGRVGKVLSWFLKHYSTQVKTVGIFNEHEAISGYDVFFAMAQRAYLENADPGYKEEASTYVLKVYGATKSLEAHTEKI